MIRRVQGAEILFLSVTLTVNRSTSLKARADEDGKRFILAQAQHVTHSWYTSLYGPSVYENRLISLKFEGVEHITLAILQWSAYLQMQNLIIDGRTSRT